MLVFMGGFGVWTQVCVMGSCVDKDFWDKICNLIFPNFMEQQLMLVWLNGKTRPW